MDNTSKWKLTIYICILVIVCIVTFLIAKYIVRSNISNNEIPVDTSERLK